MLRYILILMTAFGLWGCRNMDNLNKRDLSEGSSVGEKTLSGTNSDGGKSGDSKGKTDDDTKTAPETDKETDSEKDGIDPDAKPDDHTNIDLDKCFQVMPKDRDPGPFFREEKIVTSWRGSKRTVIKKVQITPPPPGLNICKTILDECIVCTSWDVINPTAKGDENKCDDFAEQCTNELKKECKCVRS